ncbi:hypothetical protein CC80DRAFT_556625 [Byssothecium circinans]|uniref:Uncharacterized protein n=1 Tax=Byssothecium circinans TaxID=147558 RepID=A0A6A5T6D9_9PLEO|nr:hypothetical protein CC80DRAFT_556625 [Byssothecium circinans]
MTSEDPTHPHDSVQYETEERLLGKQDARDISRILDIPLSSINNFSPLPIPVLGGAARVKRFREDEKAPFVTQPSNESDHEPAPHISPVVLPQESGGIPHNAIDELEGWPHFATPDEFSLPVEEPAGHLGKPFAVSKPKQN